MPKRRGIWDYNEMGLFFYGREAYDLAIEEFKRAMRVSLAPNAALEMNLGAAYLGKKMYREARACLDRALALEPDNQKAHLLAYQTLEALGLAPQAHAHLARTHALGPESPEGRRAADILRVRAASPVGAPGTKPC